MPLLPRARSSVFNKCHRCRVATVKLGFRRAALALVPRSLREQRKISFFFSFVYLILDELMIMLLKLEYFE
ncbi:uncharacterized protein G2W53_033472 [Senna tora]|uniref:Uncharacterized protein n=1 Tax=Senna tora TaxID=362788 RepID=A0A834WB08_9FABA|nr:uncharacterized protein G2W53_033472 [Senna tora]